MMKRFSVVFLSLLMVLSSTIYSATATNNINPFSSFYLSSYHVNIEKGVKRGEIEFNFDVDSSKCADFIGISKIVVHSANNEETITITGTINNGLLIRNSDSNIGSFLYHGISGVTYYADVTFYATSGGSSDSYTVTTKTIKAP